MANIEHLKILKQGIELRSGILGKKRILKRTTLRKAVIKTSLAEKHRLHVDKFSYAVVGKLAAVA